MEGLFFYLAFFALIIFLLVLPLRKYDLGYWFNIGQAPHSSRFSAKDIIKRIYGLVAVDKILPFCFNNRFPGSYQKPESIFKDKTFLLFTLLTLGILVEAAIFQVTSYTPPDNNIFFHSFAIAYILTASSQLFPFDFNTAKMTAACCVGVLLWWSSVYWKYFDRVFERIIPKYEQGRTNDR